MFYRNHGSWEPSRGQTQPRSRHLQPWWSAFNATSSGVKGHKKRCFTLKTSWSPGTSDLWGFSRAQLHSRARGPSHPADQEVTWDKHVVIAVILGICPNLFTWNDWAALAAIPHTSRGFAAQQGLTSLNERGTQSPTWERHCSLVSNLYTTHCHVAWGRGVDQRGHLTLAEHHCRRQGWCPSFFFFLF